MLHHAIICVRKTQLFRLFFRGALHNFFLYQRQMHNLRSFHQSDLLLEKLNHFNWMIEWQWHKAFSDHFGRMDVLTGKRFDYGRQQWLNGPSGLSSWTLYPPLWQVELPVYYERQNTVPYQRRSSGGVSVWCTIIKRPMAGC